MVMPGFTEWLIIGGIALLVWGPTKLPQLGGAIGKAIRNFKTATGSPNYTEQAKEDQEEKESRDSNV